MLQLAGAVVDYEWVAAWARGGFYLWGRKESSMRGPSLDMQETRTNEAWLGADFVSLLPKRRR